MARSILDDLNGPIKARGTILLPRPSHRPESAAAAKLRVDIIVLYQTLISGGGALSPYWTPNQAVAKVAEMTGTSKRYVFKVLRERDRIERAHGRE
jgi:hypothetical protein